MPSRSLLRLVFTLTFSLPCGVSLRAAAEAMPSPAEVLTVMEQVGHWQLTHPDQKPKRPRTGWIHAAYTFGAMELANLSAQPRFHEAMLATGRANSWQLGPRPFHADDHAIGQLYLSLYARERDPAMLVPLRARFDTILAQPPPDNMEHDSAKNPGRGDTWTWCDALFMAPATWIGLGRAIGDARYIDFAVERWWKTSDHLYDREAHLFFRDNRYFAQREANGAKIFWGRGNGWVMGGLVRVLQVLPMNHPARARFEQQFREMAEALLKLQQEDGLWRASLLDPESYPNQETSGSGFYCYAFAWGVNQGLLDRALFLPATLRAWRALVGCVTPEGKLTHVQPVGGSPKTFDPESNEEYGAGAFLLAGAELYRLALDAAAPGVTVSVSNPSDKLWRCGETVEVDVDATALGLPSGPIAVMDGLAGRLLPAQVIDLTTAGEGRTLVFQVDLAPGEMRSFTVRLANALPAVPAFPVKTHARFVPERQDDFAWENDRVAFRMYGPALAKGEGTVSSGLDVWAKRTRRLVVDAWYKRRYHKDEGEGLDYYHVGSSRGAGGIGIWAQGKLYPSGNFARSRVLAEGAIRTVFELEYETWDAAGRAFTESKRISLDAGSNLNRVESVLRSPVSGPMTLGVGLTLRAGVDTWVSDPQAGLLAHWEPEVAPNGRIGTAVIVPGGFKEIVDAAENRLALAEAELDRTFVYYAGAGWNQSGDFGDANAWETYVRDFARRLASPLVVKIQPAQP
jgi:unsaturated rhamnogalacturonyl hydrolase